MRSEIEKQVENIVVAGTTYSDILELEQASLGNVEATLDILATDGTAFTLDVITQYSYDKEKWFDHATKVFTQVTDATVPSSETLDINTNAMYTRFKYLVAGVDVDVDFELYALGM